MKKIFVIVLSFIPLLSFSQGIYNNGANIVITSGSYVIVDGGANSNYVNTNGGLIDIDGTMQIEGNFTNNAVNNAFTNVNSDGTFIFAGTNQTITSPISNFANFEKITINSGSTTSIAVASGVTTNGILDVDGTFVSETPSNKGVGGSLITATGAGSIIGTGTITINRYFNVNGIWQYISVPMTNQQSDIFTENTSSGNFNPNFYTYNEAFNQTAIADPNNTNYSNYDYGSGYNFWEAWSQVQATVGAPVELNPAIGYICYNEGDLNTVFTTGAGNPDRLNNDASYSPAVSYTLNDNTGGAGDFYDGWNLIGNPYQSALDWDDASWTRTNISNTVYLWDGDNGNYVYHFRSSDDHISGTGQTLNSDANARYIPAMQSFMVKATAATPSLTIPASARVHNDNQLYKGGTETADFDYIKLQISNNTVNLYDQTIVRFIDDYQISEEIDDYDAYKAFATTPNVPQLSSLVSNNGIETPLAINSLPIANNVEYETIPLSVVAKNAGEYTFSANEINTKYLNTFYLVDGTDESAIYIDLLTTPEYTIYIEEGEYRNRFFIFACYTATDIDDAKINNSSNVNIHSFNKFMYISIADIDDMNGNVILYDALGRNVFSATTNSSHIEFDLSYLPTGSYIVKYNTQSKIITQKIILH